MMTYRANTSPLIAVYENSGQSMTGSGTQQLEFDTVLHDNGSVSSNEFTIAFNSFVTSDVKNNSTTGIGGRLMMDINGTRLDGKGSVIAGEITSTNAGASNEIIASNVTAEETVELFFQRTSSVEITFNTFTRILGVITT
jgi:hypothetical protein